MTFIQSFSFLGQYWKFFVNGLYITVALAIISIILGTILGVVLTMMKRSKVKVISIIAKAYIGSSEILHF
ncbi:hypothetical protein [Lentilactobacillus farraginis]|uniref:Amino acid ABC transporter, permease protein n=1 Tax=Lentilactobacillus farraginis DSM 18382 = JCM 14108 TaxID=1423743 RepID=X0QGH1_9LACO|nr:hypothetical protein [Lentilactobacillus farraginis]GAF37715.1 hypothetical protein JCM14108_2772 [Lentilactobacillus farraginis DSM 18382 = JCM 14108]